MCGSRREKNKRFSCGVSKTEERDRDLSVREQRRRDSDRRRPWLENVDAISVLFVKTVNRLGARTTGETSRLRPMSVGSKRIRRNRSGLVCLGAFVILYRRKNTTYTYSGRTFFFIHRKCPRTRGPPNRAAYSSIYAFWT